MANLSTKTGLPSFSSADSPIVNYFTDSGFERGTNGVIPSGWAQYNDGATATPVDGTGGAAVSQVTMLVSNSSPIRGSFSAIISKDAANRQGVGYSFLFTISNVDKGVTAGVEFEMQTSANYASGDVVFYIYDVTNSVLITPRARSLPALPNFGRFISDYGLQTGTQYRFILHIATTNANAWTLKLDTMVNSTTRNSAPGPAAGIYESPTSFTIGAVTTPPTLGSGGTSIRSTAITDDGWAEIRYEVRQTAIGSAGSGDYLFPIPSGLNIDYSRIATANGSNTPLADCGGGSLTVNASNFALKCYAINSGAYSNKIYCLYFNDSTGFTTWGSAGGSLGSTTVIASFTVKVPIVQFLGSATNGPTSVTQWASDDGTSDVLGPQGSPVPNVGFSTGTTTRVFSFSIPQDLRQFVRVEYNRSGNGWGAASDIYPFSGGNNAGSTNFYGIRGEWTSSTNYQVSFGNQGTRVNSSAASNGTDAWSTEFSGGSRFRVGLSVGGVFIGVNLAQGNFPGFYQAGFAPGLTTGTTITADNIGYLIYAPDVQIITVTVGSSSNTGTLYTLPAGVWDIQGIAVVDSINGGSPTEMSFYLQYFNGSVWVTIVDSIKTDTVAGFTNGSFGPPAYFINSVARNIRIVATQFGTLGSSVDYNFGIKAVRRA